ncbi:hypothetical protein DFP97_103368 [Paenibacillus prosopidis]|uniref:Uncharacterized protein n=1 Tax=Paenibacillus prosopidis TaxID=630520 RepID=A0A368W8A2_9BACL|nr:hypothetical protein DFP97_103368 [Paenibacillus prosopidis]
MYTGNTCIQETFVVHEYTEDIVWLDIDKERGFGDDVYK